MPKRFPNYQIRLLAFPCLHSDIKHLCEKNHERIHILQQPAIFRHNKFHIEQQYLKPFLFTQLFTF